ncbi:PREDICTED: gamma-interferon-inducible lysosomal thiol reductase [Drosophila arizonae]|uniref:Gamma-interferon-inducible lysosomal thiol reductase n=1 Tax=Drosophila arizonae TaxID=7263 RepID=A0ABM1NLN2_DROAR|nr:PREDICTED: gamma-interferon-inducible lysosomal thiol reductase [Drosophila arizonae]
MKSFTVFLLLTLGIVACSARHHHEADAPKLPITLYYEALCPYCMHFVTTQLNPSMVRKDRLHYTNLTLVPFGNAHLNEKGEVTCQHGEDECELNAWHACILEHNDINISLKLIACMMRGRKNNLDKCANRYGIDVTAVKDCKSARSVDEILQKYAEATAQVDFRGVPAIAVDNEFKSDDQDELTDNFDQTFCAKYKAKFNIRLKNC